MTVTCVTAGYGNENLPFLLSLRQRKKLTEARPHPHWHSTLRSLCRRGVSHRHRHEGGPRLLVVRAGS